MITLLWRGLLLRCPRCGVGKLYRRGYTMYESCGSCGWVFEREEGYWTGAMAINLIVTEALIFIGIVPLLVLRASVPLTMGVGLTFAILTPLLFYWHSKSLWMTADFILHPAPLVSAGRIMTVEELRRLVTRPSSSPSSSSAGSAAQPLDVDEQQGDVSGGHAGDA
jgi:uncharacterized protein (DUF983 family)